MKKYLFTFLFLMNSAYGYLKPYDALLKKHVSPGEKGGIQLNLVNYEAIEKDPNYSKAMAQIQKQNPDQLSPQQQMAFWINAYNLFTLDLIIREKPQESIKGLSSLFQSVWKKYEFTVNGKQYTLDEIEHEILRPMGDPRIHMAIVCASVSCPDLRKESYRAQKLNQQLNDQTRKFLENPGKGLRIENRELKISKIFDWFEEDFQNGVPTFIKKYTGFDFPIDGHLDYNWDLNRKEN